MAVIINDTCINCAACIDECPVQAIVDEDDNPVVGEEIYYVYPDKCIECIDEHNEPACATACPTEGCITWDMPFTSEYKDHYNDKNYVNGKNYVFEDATAEMPFRSDISKEDRKSHKWVIE